MFFFSLLLQCIYGLIIIQSINITQNLAQQRINGINIPLKGLSIYHVTLNYGDSEKLM